jgi:peptide/nickel transport system substrate-binding protein
MTSRESSKVRGRRLRRTPAVVLAALCVLLAGVPVALGQEGGGGGRKLVFTVGMTNDIRTVNPLSLIEAPEYELAFMNYDLLVHFDQETLAPAPGLAEDWEVSEDGLTWTFTIRDDATWHDGEPVTAHDIAFTYNYIVDNAVSLYANYFPATDEIVARDDTTLVWKTKQPTLAPEWPPWVYILPEHIWGEFKSLKEAEGFDNVPAIGSGPFQLVEWKRGQFIRMRAYKDYWGGAPTIDEVVVRVFKNQEAMVQALKKGEIDFAEGISAQLFDSLENAEGIETHVAAAGGFTNLIMNVLPDGERLPACGGPCDSTGHPALLDPQVRLAIAHAIDKEALIDRVLSGYGQYGTTVVPPQTAPRWHYEPTEDELIDFDLEAANAILDEAGYEDTDGDGVREMPGGGRPLEMRLMLRSESSDSIKMGPFIQGWLKQIGIETKNEAVTDAKLLDEWGVNNFDLYTYGWGPDPDPDFILSTFTTGQCLSWADTCYSNPEYDRLYQQQHTTVDEEERKSIVEEMQRILYQDNPEIVLFYDNDLQAYRSDRWTGFVEQPEPQGYLLFGYGPYSYRSIEPVSASQDDGGQGGSAAVWVIGAGVIVVGAVAAALVRRRSGAEERE